MLFVFNKGKKVPLVNRLTVIFCLVTIITISLMTFLTLHVQKDQLLTITSEHLLDSAVSVVEKISILQATVDSRQFDNKLEYYLSIQRAIFLERGYTLNHLLINESGKIVQSSDSQLDFTIPDDLLNDMLINKTGGLNLTIGDEKYSIAYAYSLERHVFVLLMINQDEFLKPIYRLGMMIISIGALAVLLLCLVSWFVARGISKPAQAIAYAAARIEEGNLDIKIPELDNIPELSALSISFNKIICSLVLFAGYMKDSTIKLNQSRLQLTQSAQAVKQFTDDIGGNLERTATDVHRQMNFLDNVHSRMGRVVELAGDINYKNQLSVNLSKGVMEKAEQGKQTIDKTSSDIRLIYSLVLNTRDTIGNLDQKLQEIKSIYTSIENISTKTSLIAVNANIQAARAGEAGRAFSVVAREVSNLAEETRSQVKEADAILFMVQDQFKQLQKEYNNIYHSISFANDATDNTGNIFMSIINSAEESSNHIEDIALSTSSIVEMLQQISFEVDAVYKQAANIDGSIPDMLDKAGEMRKYSGVTLDQSSHLGTIADNLQGLIDSLNYRQMNNRNHVEETT